MIAFDPLKRSHAFGVYTGCPCKVTLSKGTSTTDPNYPKGKFDQEVKDLIAQWKSACEKFVSGPTVGPRISENWNKSIMLPYGKYVHIPCIFDQSAPGGGNYCKYSLKETGEELDG
jgi:hypothetical protein